MLRGDLRRERSGFVLFEFVGAPDLPDHISLRGLSAIYKIVAVNPLFKRTWALHCRLPVLAKVSLQSCAAIVFSYRGRSSEPPNYETAP